MAAESVVANLSSHEGITNPRSRLWLCFPLVAGLLAGVGSYIALGHSLWLFFAPLLLAAFLIPYFALAEETISWQIVACLLVVVGVEVTWRAVTHLSLFDWIRCGAVAGAYAVMLGGIAVALARLLGRTFAAALVAMIGFAWLSWPIWLCPWLDGPHAQSAVNNLAFAHPLLALNRVVFELYHEWDRYPLMYQITILNQDVLYEIPAGIFWSCAMHLMVGAAGFFAASIRAKSRGAEVEKKHVG